MVSSAQGHFNKFTGEGGDGTLNTVISRQPALPSGPQLPHIAWLSYWKKIMLMFYEDAHTCVSHYSYSCQWYHTVSLNYRWW